jgi:hypothetical protein
MTRADELPTTRVANYLCPESLRLIDSRRTPETAKHRMQRRTHLRPLSMLIATTLAVVYDVQPAWAEADQAAGKLNRPTYESLRFDEDWSSLRGADLSATDDFSDRLKFIPLNRDESAWLTLGGQLREREEYFRSFLFGASVPQESDAYLLSRLRLSADLHISPYLRLFAEEKSAFALNRELQGGSTSTYVEEYALQNAFADVIFPAADEAKVTLRGGRQEMLLGSQRLVGEPDFGQTRRTYDGGRGLVQIRNWTIDLFGTQPVVPQTDQFNKSSSQNKLFGVYAAGPIHPVNLDLYWLGVDNAAASFNGTSGRERRHTLGGRAWGKIGQTGVDFELEGAAQFGTIGREEIAAWMLTGILGYTAAAVQLSPRIYAEFDYASGDTKKGGRVGTFNQLYPAAHSFLGYIDYIGRQNIVSESTGLSISPLHDLTLSVQHYFFWRASDADALYNKSGTVFRAGTGTTARYVGAELDLFASYNFTRHLLGYAGYSHFFAGDFIRRTGPSEDSDFVYLALQYTL